MSNVFCSGVITMETRIRDLREDHDLSQRTLAEAIGITQRKYSYLETEQQPWTDEVLVRLAEYFHTSVDYLLKRTDNPNPYSRKNNLD